jgi:D,D-heptose 1,7-bisphosphate phosphatase
MIAVILAGGQGTRLKRITGDTPKPLVSIAGVSVLKRQLQALKPYGITEVFILTGYMGHLIEAEIGDGTDIGMCIHCIQEQMPLGTAGALKQIEKDVNEEFFLVFGDIIFDIDINSLWQFHRSKNAMATLVVHPNDHPYDSDLLEVDAHYRISAFYPKPHAEGTYYQNLVNSGLAVLSPDIFAYIPSGRKSDLSRDVYSQLLQTGGNIFAYNTAEYIKDMGTPARYDAVTQDIMSGKVERWNMRHKRQAIFLDRDGTINVDMDNDISVSTFELLPHVVEAIKLINCSDYLAIVITNQPMAAKGFISLHEQNMINKKMDTLLGLGNAKLDALYMCIHHPQSGFPGEIKELKIECDCRKPKPGMVEEASKSFNIDLANSYFIGNSLTDVETAKNAGVTPILVNCNDFETKQLLSATHVFPELIDAVQTIQQY